jgi:phosphoenolpyruvate synthase/pyruvate phosphate dikinase
MVVQHRDLVIDARTPPALPRWRVRERAAAPECRLLPILRPGIDPAAPVWNLAELGLDDAVDVGMDVAYLADLYARGFSVPPAFALGIAAYQESVEAGGVREQLAEIGARLAAHGDDLVVIDRLAARAAELVRASGPTPRVAAAVGSAYRQLGIEDLGGARVTVLAPSLDAGLDMGGATPANGPDTVSHHQVRGARTVLQRVVDCWGRAAGVPHLRQGTARGSDERAVAVLVRAEVSAEGTGTADVDDHGQVVVRPAPHVVLGEDDIAALERLARRVQEHWGRPTALSWAIAQGRPWILRARPRS